MPRTSRPRPHELTVSWPEKTADEPTGEVARRFANNVRAAIGDRSIRSAAAACEVNHATLLGILAGRVWPDLYTISKLETGLDTELWPGRIRRT